MQNRWYGDNRDLVKWSVLVQLARLNRATKIVQVAYLRQGALMRIEIDGELYDLPKAVMNHFPRDVADITRLSSPELQIDVIKSPFSDREQYTKEVLNALRSLVTFKSRAIIFLDPDTGLEPNKPNTNHVLKSELAQIWSAMRDNDIIVFYQHKSHENPWIEQKRKAFESALGLSCGAAKVAQSKPATDVAFFYATKLLAA